MTPAPQPQQRYRIPVGQEFQSFSPTAICGRFDTTPGAEQIIAVANGEASLQNIAAFRDAVSAAAYNAYMQCIGSYAENAVIKIVDVQGNVLRRYEKHKDFTTFIRLDEGAAFPEIFDRYTLGPQLHMVSTGDLETFAVQGRVWARHFYNIFGLTYGMACPSSVVSPATFHLNDVVVSSYNGITTVTPTKTHEFLVESDFKPKMEQYRVSSDQWFNDVKGMEQIASYLREFGCDSAPVRKMKATLQAYAKLD